MFALLTCFWVSSSFEELRLKPGIEVSLNGESLWALLMRALFLTYYSYDWSISLFFIIAGLLKRRFAKAWFSRSILSFSRLRTPIFKLLGCYFRTGLNFVWLRLCERSLKIFSESYYKDFSVFPDEKFPLRSVEPRLVTGRLVYFPLEISTSLFKSI
jgi:hypothetical protein